VHHKHEQIHSRLEEQHDGLDALVRDQEKKTTRLLWYFIKSWQVLKYSKYLVDVKSGKAQTCKLA